MLRLSRYLSRRVWGSPTSTTAEKVEETIDPPPKTEAELEREAAERRENLKREAAAAKAEEAAKEVRRAEKAKAEEAKRVKLAAEAAAINALITKANKNKASSPSGASLRLCRRAPPRTPTTRTGRARRSGREHQPLERAVVRVPSARARRRQGLRTRAGKEPLCNRFRGVQMTRGDWVPKQRRRC